MPSPDPRRENESGLIAPLLRLLDLAFGFLVWAAHFSAIYVTTALACVLGLGNADAAAKAAFDAALVVATLAVAGITLWHGLRRYRQQRDLPDLRFRLSVTAGADAIAGVAILWQLVPVLLLPPCV